MTEGTDLCHANPGGLNRGTVCSPLFLHLTIYRCTHTKGHILVGQSRKRVTEVQQDGFMEDSNLLINL